MNPNGYAGSIDHGLTSACTAIDDSIRLALIQTTVDLRLIHDGYKLALVPNLASAYEAIHDGARARHSSDNFSISNPHR